ncbi:MAG: hypothetical protein RL593_199 [Pseudomonadota bacterium]
MNLHPLSRTKGLHPYYLRAMKAHKTMHNHSHVKASLLIGLLVLISCLEPLQAQEEVVTQPLQQEAQEDTGANSDFIFKYLAAEVAAQRGELGLSNQIFFDLAKLTNNERLAERATQLAIFTQNAKIGLDAAQLWVKLNSEAVEARQTLTQLLVMTGNLNAAQPHLQKLLEKPDTRANGFLYLNTLLAQQTDKTAVLSLVQTLSEPYPNLGEAHLTISQAALQTGNTELALKEASLANKLKPNWELGAIQQAEILYAQSPDKAINFYRSFLNNNSNANDARLSLVKMLVAQKRYSETKSDLNKLAKAAIEKPDVLAVIGALSLQSNLLDEAEKYLKQALTSKLKDKDQVYLYLGQLAEKKKNDDEALNWYSQIQAPQNEHIAQTKSNYFLEAKINSALIISRTQGTDAAVMMLDDLQDLTNLQIALVIQTQANLMMQAKRYQEAFDLLDKAVLNVPDHPELIYDHAMVAERLEKFDIVESQLRKLIKLKPSFAQAYNALGYSFADRNIHLEEAYQLIEKALSFNPNDHFVIDSMGWVNYRLGKLDKAVEYLKAAYKFQADAEIAAHLGEVLWQQGHQKEAEKIWNEALKNSPENEALIKTVKQFKP